MDLMSNLANLRKYTVLNIIGPSGAGKSTFAQYLVSDIIARKNFVGSCVWISASKEFSSRRLAQLYSGKKLDYLRKNIFILPRNNKCSSFDEQKQIIQKICNPETILPPHLRVIVIDNISHHLRYEISKCSTFQEQSILKNKFFNLQLKPLVLFCSQADIFLVLTHEVTDNPQKGTKTAFFSKPYEKLESIDFFLNYSEILGKHEIFIKNPNGNEIRFDYQIKNHGFLFS